MGFDLKKATTAPTKKEMLNNIFELENALGQMPQLEMATEHYFCGGVYARQLFIPAGTILTGEMHSEDNLNIMLYGDIEVATDEGVRRINEPCIIKSKAGVKRAGYTYKDTVWITLHATESESIEEIKRKFIVDREEVNSFLEEQDKLGG